MKILHILIIILVAVNLNAQFSQTYRPYNDIESISFGIKATKVLGENLNTLPLIPNRPYNDKFIQGGSFDNAQTGIEARYSMPLGTSERWRIPIILDYTFYSAKELQAASPNLYIHFKNESNLLGLNTGLHYFLAKYPFSKAKIYTGLELRTVYVHNVNYMHRVDYKQPGFEEYEFTFNSSKKNGFRLGTYARLGVEGLLAKNLYVNISFAGGVLNLVGRDNDRGELFTPDNTYQTEESLVYTIDTSFLLQYRLH